MNCSFCEKIYDVEKLRNMSWTDRYKLGVTNCITFDKENNTYGIWHECDDDYYSKTILEINFCPKCGRTINLKYVALR